MTGEELKFRRQRIGLTPEDLARLAGVDVLTVHRWESGLSQIQPAIRIRVLLTKLWQKQRELLTDVGDSRQWENWLARRLTGGIADNEPSQGT